MDTNKMKGLMAEKGYSQRQLAKEAGVGLNHINDVLNNKVSPRLSLVQRLCEILEIDDLDLRMKIFFDKSIPKTEQ